MSNRISIDVVNGTIELEGEQDFVESQLDKLLPLIEAREFGSPKQSIDPEDDALQEKAESSKDAASAPKKTRRGITRPPKGQSCADRILILRDEEFFKQQRTPSDIVEGLAARGWTHKSNQVSAAAGNMFNRGEIQRTKSGKGFTYYWDRD